MTSGSREPAAGSVGLRLRVAFGLLLAFLLLAGTVGIVALTAQVQEADEVVDRIGPLTVPCWRPGRRSPTPRPVCVASC